MDNTQVNKILESQKILNDLPNSELVNQMDILSQEHERIRDSIIQQTVYLDKLEELYNNIMKVYQQRNGK